MYEPGFRIAVVVDPTLPIGLIANTVATICIGLGAVRPGFGGTSLADASMNAVYNSADRPVPILQATEETIRQLLLKAIQTSEDGVVVPFPRFARSLHSFADYQAEFPFRYLADEQIDGFGIAGPEKWVKSLTGSLKLLR